jgi:hypothetical protein
MGIVEMLGAEDFALAVAWLPREAIFTRKGLFTNLFR